MVPTQMKFWHKELKFFLHLRSGSLMTKASSKNAIDHAQGSSLPPLKMVHMVKVIHLLLSVDISITHIPFNGIQR